MKKDGFPPTTGIVERHSSGRLCYFHGGSPHYFWSRRCFASCPPFHAELFLVSSPCDESSCLPVQAMFLLVLLSRQWVLLSFCLLVQVVFLLFLLSNRCLPALLYRRCFSLSSFPGGAFLLVLLSRQCFFLSSCSDVVSYRPFVQVFFFFSSCPCGVSSRPLIQAVFLLSSCPLIVQAI